MKTTFRILLALALVLFAGCSKKDAPITGSASAPPVSIQCAWKPGHTYQVRLEMDQTTDIEPPDPTASALHRVTFEQVCLITVTNAPAGQLRLDLEVVALGMERSKANLVSTGYDSEQGGEIFDDTGYVPILRKLVGGKLRFHLSSDGKVLRADGISEWLERALGTPPSTSRPKRPNTSTTRVVTSVTNADGTVRTSTSLVRVTNSATTLNPPLNGPVLTTTLMPPPQPVVNTSGSPATTTPALGTPSLRSGVASTLRGFFTVDLFKQLLEFNLLPSAAVRVGDHWKVQGETPITGRGRPKYAADVKFSGWQRYQGTNCVRLDATGTIAQRASKVSKKDGTLSGVLWVDMEAQFPLAMIIDKDAAFPSSSTSRAPDTNEVANGAAPKRVRQYVGMRLLSITPPAEGTTSPSPNATSPTKAIETPAIPALPAAPPSAPLITPPTPELPSPAPSPSGSPAPGL